MSDLTPRERRQQRTREAILQTAIELVRENGADNISLREIARRIDYSPAGLYEYFGSKEEIIDAICQEGNERLSRRMRQVDKNLPFEAYLLAVGQAYIQHAVDDPDYFALMFSRSTTERISAEELEAYQPGEDDAFGYAYYAIRDAAEAGIIRIEPGHTVAHAAIGVWAMVHGLAMLRITNLANYDLDYDTLQENIVKTHIRGMMVQPT